MAYDQDRPQLSIIDELANAGYEPDFLDNDSLAVGFHSKNHDSTTIKIKLSDNQQYDVPFYVEEIYPPGNKHWHSYGYMNQVTSVLSGHGILTAVPTKGVINDGSMI